jgi:hypothetical protein
VNTKALVIAVLLMDGIVHNHGRSRQGQFWLSMPLASPHFSPHCGVAAADGEAGDATRATRPMDGKSAGGRRLR